MQIITLKDKRFQSYISREQIHERVAELGKEISRDYEGEEILLLPILNGAFIFAADLVRQMTVPSQVQFVRLSTYGDNLQSTRSVKFSFGLDNLEIKGRHILIIEDIIDTGFTADYLKEHLQKEKPASLKIAAMLFKPDAFKGKDDPDYVGFSIPNKFVVGYGLDYAQLGRELDSIYQLTD